MLCFIEILIIDLLLNCRRVGFSFFQISSIFLIFVLWQRRTLQTWLKLKIIYCFFISASLNFFLIFLALMVIGISPMFEFA